MTDLSPFLSPEQIQRVEALAREIGLRSIVSAFDVLVCVREALESGTTPAEVEADLARQVESLRPARAPLQAGRDLVARTDSARVAFHAATEAHDRERLKTDDFSFPAARKAAETARSAAEVYRSALEESPRVLEALVAYAAASEEGLLRIVRALRPCFNPIPGTVLDAPRLADTVASMLEGIAASFDERSRVLSHVQVPEIRRAAEKALGPDRVEDFLRQIFDVAAHDGTGR